jgi:hypothetical protein
MAENNLSREAVQNPFEERLPTIGRQMKNPGRKPRSAFLKSDQGVMIADALMNFAGAGGDIYQKVQNKKIESDKVIQTGRALIGAMPSDDATLAGYRTHAAVTLNSKTLQSQARLNELAKSGLSDEEWEKAIQDEYVKVDSYMSENYKNYTKDPEMQKMIPISFREIMPQLVAAKEADRINREIEERVNDASDILISSARMAKTNGISIEPEGIVSKIDQAVKGLQLTSDQKDKVVLKAIIATESPALIEASKLWRGDRKSSLYEREGSIQTIENNIQNQSISNNVISLSTELEAYKAGISSGEITLEHGLALIDKRNKELNGKFATRGTVAEIIRERNKEFAARYRKKMVKESISDPNNTDSLDFTDKEKQACYRDIYSDEMNKINKEAESLPEDKKAGFIQANTSSTVARVADLAVKQGDIVKPFVSTLANLASSNIAARQLTGEKGEVTLDTTTQQAISLLDSMSPMAKYKHLEAVGGKEAKTVRAFMAYRDRGIPEPQSLAMAQSFMTNPFPPDMKRIRKGVDEVRDNLESFMFFFGDDFDNNQESYLESEIQDQISLSPEPDDKGNIDLVTEYFKKGWTNVGSLRLKGAPGYLSKSIGINGDKLEGAMRGFVWSQKSIWEPQLKALQLDEDDVFPVTDPKRGTIQIMARSKAFNANVPLGLPISLGKVRELSSQYKVQKEKDMDELETLDEAYKKVQKERSEGKYSNWRF